jgi:hypothetical protein
MISVFVMGLLPDFFAMCKNLQKIPMCERQKPRRGTDDDTLKLGHQRRMRR